MLDSVTQKHLADALLADCDIVQCNSIAIVKLIDQFHIPTSMQRIYEAQQSRIQWRQETVRERGDEGLGQEIISRHVMEGKWRLGMHDTHGILLLDQGTRLMSVGGPLYETWNCF